MREVEKKRRVALFCVCVFAFMLAMALFGCGDSSSTDGPEPSGSSEVVEQEDTADTGEVTFDVAFEFDDLTITFGSDVTLTTVDNEFSDHSGATVAVIPVTITNNSDSTHGLNMFYFNAFAPDGTKLDDISTYFLDDDITWAGEARSGATINTLMHLLYMGPGDYYIEFDTPAGVDGKVEVRLPLDLG